MKWFGAGILLGLVSCGAASGPNGSAPEVPKIYTTAFAERRVQPNMARVVFAVLTRAATADKARLDNANKTTALQAKFVELKIPENDLQTVDYRIQEVTNYQNGASKIEGYEALSRMQIRVLDVKSVGKMIDQLVALGANKIESVDFDVAEKEEMYRELLEEATSLAREKASRIAEAAGLGKITVVEAREEVSFSPTSSYKFAMAEARSADAPTTQITPTAVLRATINLTAKAKE